MHAILVAIGKQLQQKQRLERDYAKLGRVLDSFYLGRGPRMVRPRLFPRKQEVNCLARFSVRSVPEHDDVKKLIANKTGLFQRRRDGRQVSTTNEKVNVPSIADGPFIDGGDP